MRSKDDCDRRLWTRVIVTENCGNWTGGTMGTRDGKQGGYGMMYAKNPEGKKVQVYVHREAYEYHKGPIPDGMHVMHSCDNRICCNPDHLMIGTQQDNLRDMRTKKRQQHGESHWNSKLSEDDVRKIFELRGRGYLQREIAEIFGVLPNCISRVLSGRRRNI